MGRSAASGRRGDGEGETVVLGLSIEESVEAAFGSLSLSSKASGEAAVGGVEVVTEATEELKEALVGISEPSSVIV